MSLKEIQPRQTYFASKVEPRKDSGLRLAGGTIEPYFYTLSSRSTVPYVQLKGSAYTNKLVSWGEVVMVPPGQIIEVYNASWHVGDIVINTGRDYAEIPTRVTVPVPLKAVGPIGPLTDYTMQYGCDCRRAKRAYWNPGVIWNVGKVIGIRHYWWESSFNTNKLPSDGSGPPFNFVDRAIIIPPFTEVGMIPLGMGAPNDIIPMSMGDVVNVTFNTGDSEIVAGNINEQFYTLEY